MTKKITAYGTNWKRQSTRRTTLRWPRSSSRSGSRPREAPNILHTRTPRDSLHRISNAEVFDVASPHELATDAPLHGAHPASDPNAKQKRLLRSRLDKNAGKSKSSARSTAKGKAASPSSSELPKTK